MRVLIYALMAGSCAYLIFGERPSDLRAEVDALGAAGEKLDLHHHVVAGLFYGSLINLALGCVALSLRRFWARSLRRPFALAPLEGRLPGRVFWSGVLLAVVLAGGVRLNLARGSLWWDELWNVKHTMSGEFRPDAKKGGALKFRETPWEKTVYYYRKPTNHPPMAIASRLSLGAWRKLSGAGRAEFNELAVRLPTLLAGLASVAAIAVLLRSWGFSGGGLVAALLLALHPWHVRYGVEARAYGFVVLWTILGCLWLGKLIRSGGGGWRYWLLFGLNQLLLVWSLPNGIYYALAFGIAGGVFCLSRLPGTRAVLLARLVAVNLAAAMAFMFLFLPNALQIGEWGEINDHHYLSTYVLGDVATQLGFGMELAWEAGVEADGLVSFTSSVAAHPVAAWLVIVLGSAALLAGLVALWVRAPRRLLLFLAVACGAGVSLLVTWQLHQHFYQRYVVAYLIVPVVALAAVGAVELASWLHRRGLPGWVSALVVVLLVGSFAMFTRGQRVVLNTRSYTPFREVAEFVGREAKLGQISVIGYGLGGRVFQIYYPEAEFADTLEELDAALAKARERARPTFVVSGYRQFNEADPGSAAGAMKVADPALFDEVVAYGGIDPMFYFRVMRLREN